jgi:divinyl chlorophyllide a 8-vinyl-reductase
VQTGRPFLVFGDGRRTACKPISDGDLARFLVLCLSDPAKRNRILPIGGPGPAITPLDQANHLFEMLGKPPRIRRVPLALMDVIVGSLAFLGRFSQGMRDKAEFARTGQYYATESMLLWDPVYRRYDADATPEFGSETLWDHYAALLSGNTSTDLGDHAMF